MFGDKSNAPLGMMHGTERPESAFEAEARALLARRGVAERAHAAAHAAAWPLRQKLGELHKERERVAHGLGSLTSANTLEDVEALLSRERAVDLLLSVVVVEAEAAEAREVEAREALRVVEEEFNSPPNTSLRWIINRKGLTDPGAPWPSNPGSNSAVPFAPSVGRGAAASFASSGRESKAVAPPESRLSGPASVLARRAAALRSDIATTRQELARTDGALSVKTRLGKQLAEMAEIERQLGAA